MSVLCCQAFLVRTNLSIQMKEHSKEKIHQGLFYIVYYSNWYFQASNEFMSDSSSRSA